MRFLKLAVVLVQGVTSGFLIYALFHLNILQAWQNLAIAGALVILFLFTLWKLVLSQRRLDPKTGKKRGPTLATQILCILLSLVATTGSLLAYRYIDPISDFIADATKESKEHTKVYYLLTPKLTDEVEKPTVESLKDKNIGFLTLDPYLTQAKSELEKTITFSAKDYDAVTDLVADFDDTYASNSTKDLPAIVLEAERLEMLSDLTVDTTSSESSAKTSALSTLSDRVEITFTFEIIVDDTNYSSTKNLTEEPFIAYISGTDSRQGINGVARSDVNILAVVNPKQAKILLLTIPRDTYVQLHGTTGIKDKLTHAGIYGIDMSKTTIEDFLNIQIDHTIKVSFATVVNVVDAIGGIDIDSDTAMTLGVEGKNKKCTYVKGIQRLDGDCALRYARERKSYGTGDNHRGQNQQQVLTAIIEKISSNKSLLLDYPKILKAAEGTFETSFTYDDLTSFVRLQLAENKSWQVESIQITGTARYTGTYSMGVNLPLYVMDADESSIKAAQEKIAAYLQ